jgi:hypothetical protein
LGEPPVPIDIPYEYNPDEFGATETVYNLPSEWFHEYVFGVSVLDYPDGLSPEEAMRYTKQLVGCQSIGAVRSDLSDDPLVYRTRESYEENTFKVAAGTITYRKYTIEVFRKSIWDTYFQ